MCFLAKGKTMREGYPLITSLISTVIPVSSAFFLKKRSRLSMYITEAPAACDVRTIKVCAIGSHGLGI